MPIPLIPALIGNAINNAIENSAAQSAAESAAQQQSAPIGLMRAIPAESLQGRLVAAAIDSVQIGRKTLPLSPAAQIRNEANMVVLPTSIQQPVHVRYLVDGMGYVYRIWILTPAELAASR